MLDRLTCTEDRPYQSDNEYRETVIDKPDFSSHCCHAPFTLRGGSGYTITCNECGKDCKMKTLPGKK